MIAKYGIKTKIIHNFKDFQDYKKRLFLSLLSSGMKHTVIHSVKKNKTLKISDFIKYKNTEFVRKCLRQENLSVFNEMFHTLNQNHHCNTRAANNDQPDLTPTLNTHYGTSP